MKAISAIPVFHVRDVDAAVKFYVHVLGFTEAFRYGTYSGLKLGPCEVHLTLPGDFGRTIGGGTAYIICDEVDDYYASVKAAGAAIRSDLAPRMYGMKDFVLLDPDGNQLSFGCDLDND
jgi:catechol 2,3-dioxygenase-like lactoylglutathione lyase family enzyme